MTLSSSPTQFPCILHSRVSLYSGFSEILFTSLMVLVCTFYFIYFSLSFVSLRDMGLFPESAGEEICHWEKWSEHTDWTHIWLQLWRCQGLSWEDKRVGTFITSVHNSVEPPHFRLNSQDTFWEFYLGQYKTVRVETWCVTVLKVS